MSLQHNPKSNVPNNGCEKGLRAESAASWYFRLNGFLSIPGFIFHLDSLHAELGHNGQPRHARTEADLLAVRFPYSREQIKGQTMADDPLLVTPSLQKLRPRPMFILVEVKAGDCRMNGPWTDAAARNMQRAICRLGFESDDTEVDRIADSMYRTASWKTESFVLQYVCVGARKNHALQQRYPNVLQIDWRDVGRFLHNRLSSFPPKLPSGFVHDQWPDFGRRFGRWFVDNGASQGAEASADAVAGYVVHGTFNNGA